MVNFEKSGVFFSVNDGLQQTLSNVLGVFTPLNTSKYLGLPYFIGKNKSLFMHIKDRV